MDPIVLTYAVYVTVSLGLTIWVGRTLHKNGRAFLVRVFGTDEGMADSVNHLLIVGFYLVNLGFITLRLKSTLDVESARQAIELLSVKIGVVTLVLGAMHFFNLYVFSRIFRRGAAPVVARDDGYTPIAPSLRAPAYRSQSNALGEPLGAGSSTTVPGPLTAALQSR